MNAQELQALVVDWHMSELRPEVAALLEAYLAQNPSAKEESRRIEETLALTRKVVQENPGLVPAPGTDLREPVKLAVADSRPGSRHRLAWLKVAAVLALAGGTCLFGYKLGAEQGSAPAPEIVLKPAKPAREVEVRPALAANNVNSPWAKYRIARNGEGQGLLFTRVEHAQSGEAEVR